MRKLILILFLFSLIACQASTKKVQTEIVDTEPPTGYDEMLAAKLGADDYGMSKYVIAFLKAGPNRSQDSTTLAELQAAHLANMRRMSQAGQLVLAGPFLEDGDIRGIFIFAVETVEEARKLTDSDPMIQAGRLIMEMHPWYGSSALKQVTGIHSRIRKISF